MNDERRPGPDSGPPDTGPVWSRDPEAAPSGAGRDATWAHPDSHPSQPWAPEQGTGWQGTGWQGAGIRDEQRSAFPAGGYGHDAYGPGPYGDPFAGARRPGIVTLAPMRVGDILGGAFAAMRFNPVAIIVAALAFYLVVTLIGLLLDVRALTHPFGDDNVVNWSDLLALVFGPLLTGFLIVPVVGAVRGEKMSVARAWATLRPNLWRLVGTSLLVTVITVVLASPGIALVFVLMSAGRDDLGTIVLAGLGVACWLIFLGFVTVWFSFSGSASVIEGLRPVAAVRRSAALVRHAYWPIFGIRLLAALISGAFAALLIGPFTMIMMFVLGTSGDGGSAEVGVVAGLLMALVTAVINAMTSAYSAAVTALLYVDRRFRTEGYALTIADEAARGPGSGPGR